MSFYLVRRQRSLDRLESGECAGNALTHVMEAENEPKLRQVGVVYSQGASAAYARTETDGWSGHHCGPNFSVQGNVLADEDTVVAMVTTFTDGERLLIALEAGQAAGGDSRGRQSVALILRDPEVYPLVDLRVVEHSDSLAELRRIHEIARVELFPFVAALPTKENPRGNFAAIQTEMTPKT